MAHVITLKGKKLTNKHEMTNIWYAQINGWKHVLVLEIKSVAVGRWAAVGSLSIDLAEGTAG